MKRFSSQFNKAATKIRLSAAERSDLRERIVSYMEYHPLPKALEQKNQNTPQLISEPYTALAVSYRHLSSWLGAFAVFVLVFIPVAAERAVPGDVLYPVKVQFNEELRSTLSFSPYAKVEWETKRLERRLAEARLLADEGKLTDEIEAEMAQAVQAHSDAAKLEIEVIRASDSDEAAIAELAFASALEVQSEVLESQEARAGETGRSVSTLAGVVAEARSGVEASQLAANPSYEKLLARLELETTHAEELFASVRESASTEEVANIERRFADIKRKIDKAVVLKTETVDTDNETTLLAEEEDNHEAIESGEKEAKELLKLALVDTRKLITFMTDIDVRNSVSIDKLVPVTLTDEELEVSIATRLNTLQTQFAALTNKEPSPAVAAKYELGLTNLATLLQSALVAYESKDYLTIEAVLSEAELVAADLTQMVGVTSEIESFGNQASSSAAISSESDSGTDAENTTNMTQTTESNVE